MSDATIKQSGGDFTSINAFIGDGGTSATDTGTVTGTWTVKDTTDVTWNKAVIIVADSDSKQIGRPWKAGDTHYQLNGDAAGHLFTVTADVDITDIDIQGVSSSASDEIFRNSTPYDITCNKCQIGFASATAEQDVVYWDSSGTATFDFENCMFYNVGRSAFDEYDARGTVIININSCSGLSLGSLGGRADGAWVGSGGNSSADNITVNVFNSLLPSEDDHVFAKAPNHTLTVNHDRCFTNVTSANFVGSGTENGTFLTASATWTESPTGSGDEVGMTEIDTSPYDQSLVDSADNDAQDNHTDTSGPGSLSMPSTDIVGTSRPQNTNYDVGAFEVAVAGPGGATPKGVFGLALHGPLGGPI